jgi:hypothetical protein
MSASGTGIFDDDVACNIRAQYRALLRDGKAPAQATRAVLRDWQPALGDAEDGPVIWLALAAIQCRYGCLEPRVKARALAVIANGSDLEHWRATGNPALVRSRIAVLARLRAKLAAPPARSRIPTKPRKRREPVDEKAIWPLGEVFAYRLTSGRYILLHVCDYLGSDRPGAGWAPMVALLDWRGNHIPPADGIKHLPYKIRTDDPVEKHSVFMFSLGRARASELPQDRVVRHLAVRRASDWKKLVGEWGGCRCSRWRDLDHDLEDWLGWK